MKLTVKLTKIKVIEIDEKSYKIENKVDRIENKIDKINHAELSLKKFFYNQNVMGRPKIRIDGIYDRRTYDYLQSLGVDQFTFDFRPLSLNFFLSPYV